MTSSAALQPLMDEAREVTQDPIEAMRIAADLLATNAYVADRQRAAARGRPAPAAPALNSIFIRAFVIGVRVWIKALARWLDREELRRVVALGPSITRELDREASDLIESVLVLLAMHPQDAALWLRANLATIEARLAS